MPGDPKECHQHARECAEMAARARTPQQREILKNLERTWFSLAADLERNQALLEAYPPAPPAGDGNIPEQSTKLHEAAPTLGPPPIGVNLIL